MHATCLREVNLQFFQTLRNNKCYRSIITKILILKGKCLSGQLVLACQFFINRRSKVRHTNASLSPKYK